MQRVKSRLSPETRRPECRYLCWMRGIGIGLAICLVLGVLAPARAAQASTADLIRQLDGLVASFPGGAGIWVTDPNVPTPLFMHDPEA